MLEKQRKMFGREKQRKRTANPCFQTVSRAVSTFLLVVQGVAAYSDATIHVSPSGDDGASGSPQAPIRSLNHLRERLSKSDDITEVILHEGVYRGSLIIPVPEGTPPETAANLPTLVIRSGDGEEAIIDGARPLGATTPVEGWPGVYKVKNPKRHRNDYARMRLRIPSVWDAGERKRYMLVADERSVRRFRSSYCFTNDDMYIHTTDGKDPNEHAIEVSSLDACRHGLEIGRSNTIIKNLRARNFFLDCHYSSGFGVHGENVTLENCQSSNCPRGFGVYSSSVKIIRCRADDCGCGAHVKHGGATLDGNRFFKIRDDFMVPMPYQEDSGIEVYHNADGNIVLRGNICRGYGYYGIFIKARPGTYLVENNTLINNPAGIGFSHSPGQVIDCRNNIIYGSNSAILRAFNLKLSADGNCVWPGPWVSPGPLREEMKYLNDIGKGNFMADPRIANPSGDEIVLMSESPCLSQGSNGRRVGAPGPIAPTDAKDVVPPVVKLHASLPILKNELGKDPLYLASRRDVPLHIQARDDKTRPSRMKIRIGQGEWSAPLSFKNLHTVPLPEDNQIERIAVIVSDMAGNWSEPVAIGVKPNWKAPRLTEKPTIRTNEHGVAISFKTNVECRAFGECGKDKHYGTSFIVSGRRGNDGETMVANSHVLGALFPSLWNGATIFYKFWLEDGAGARGETVEGEFQLTGPTRKWHIAPDGADEESGGTAEAPWRTPQYGVDRVLPGDTLVIGEGIYAEPTLITRGGVENAAITLKSAKKWAAVFDGHHNVNTLLTLRNAPHVEIDGIEFRWYGDPDGSAIRFSDSPDFTIRNCKIWNAFWNESRAVGKAIQGSNSPGFVMEKCLVFRNDRALVLTKCPNFRIVNNTARGHVHGGLYFDESLSGSVLKNNDLTFNGNDICKLSIVDPKEMDRFECDYNNLGTNLRYWRDEPGAAPNLPAGDRRGAGKALMMFIRKGGTWLGLGHTKREWVSDATTPPEKRGQTYFRLWTFEDWKTFSGKDEHSIFADPQYVNLNEMDFRLLPTSPNIGAGEDGTTIGAMDIVEGEKEPKS